MSEIKRLKKELMKYQIFEEMLNALARSSDISLDSRIITICNALSLLRSPVVGISDIALLIFSAESRRLTCYDARLIRSERGRWNTLFVDGMFESRVLDSGAPSIPAEEFHEFGVFTETDPGFWKDKAIRFYLPVKTDSRLMGLVGMGRRDGEISRGELKFLHAYLAPLTLFLGGAFDHEDMITDRASGLVHEAHAIRETPPPTSGDPDTALTDACSFIRCEFKILDDPKPADEPAVRERLRRELARVFILFAPNKRSVIQMSPTLYLLVFQGLSYMETMERAERMAGFFETIEFPGTRGAYRWMPVFQCYRFPGPDIRLPDVIQKLKSDPAPETDVSMAVRPGCRFAGLV